MLKQSPEEYECFLNKVISIDYKGRFVLCCASDDECKDYVWESVMSVDDLLTLRGQMLQSDTCKMCRKLHVDYWMQMNPKFMEVSCEENLEDMK